MMAMRDSARNDMQGASISAFMFDGAVISIAADKRKEVEELLKEVGIKNNVEIEVKPF